MSQSKKIVWKQSGHLQVDTPSYPGCFQQLLNTSENKGLLLNYCLVSNDQVKSKLKEYLIIHCDWYWILGTLDHYEITDKYFSSFDFIFHIKITF